MRFGCKSDGKVRSDRRFPDAALGAENGDHRPLGDRVGEFAAAAHPLPLLALQHTHDRRFHIFGLERLLEVVRGAGDHGLAHQPDVRLGGKHHDRKVRQSVVDSGERLDGTDERLFDPHQDHVRLQLERQRERFHAITSARQNLKPEHAQHFLDLGRAFPIRVNHDYLGHS